MDGQQIFSKMSAEKNSKPLLSLICVTVALSFLCCVEFVRFEMVFKNHQMGMKVRKTELNEYKSTVRQLQMKMASVIPNRVNLPESGHEDIEKPLQNENQRRITKRSLLPTKDNRTNPLDSFEVDELLQRVRDSIVNDLSILQNGKCTNCPQGPAGLPGIPGLIGDSGMKGIDGQPGLQGPLGFTGATGRKGFNGVSGYKGVAGRNGFPGIYGSPGDSGPAGPRGQRGFKGHRGYRGYRGPSGAKGTKGKHGFHGMKGEDGYPGTHGEHGMWGLKGEEGEYGPKGAKGTKGERGPGS